MSGNNGNGNGLIDGDAFIQIKPENGYDGFEGWGTSLAWWGHIVGQWSDRNKQDEIMDLIFDADKGLGLNIVRYNIGGGENPAIQPNTLRPGGDVPGFQPEKGIWDWSADEGQRNVLLAAMKRGADIAEAFSNSPPYWMTVSGSVTGSEDGGNNLREECYEEFADYLTEVVKHYKEAHGVAFRTLNPLNEPVSNWWKKGNIQEGAHFSLDKQMEIIKQTARSLQLKGLTETAVSAPDENSVDETLEMLHGYDEETFNSFSQINTHSYNGVRLEEIRKLAREKGKKLWMSEYGTGGTGPHDHGDMTSVMELAERVITDLRLLQPAAWVYWQAVEDESAQNNWGFIHSDFRHGENRYEITKQYYAMAQFSKFIRPGNRILCPDDRDSIAAYDAASKQLTVVVHNREGQRRIRFDLGPFVPDGTTAKLYRTSEQENLVEAELFIYSNKITVNLEAQSVTTVVVSNITL
ncbi:O-glycosyl hydrolase [Paenibacillus sp. BK033]|uniref:glycoside hydrolase family 30 protein n=1 Tax=Paenibacillus sp. BK033 TaxID=2512133 RepID=UPI00104AA698|nr:glycoside hydrolase [Paenibacillus sp. BK033]TCM99568.1 O-glycosyl hydrolase [Paenibacillus sp. BK033]